MLRPAPVASCHSATRLSQGLAGGASAVLEAGEALGERVRELDDAIAGTPPSLTGSGRRRGVDPDAAVRLYQQGLTNFEIAEMAGVTPLRISQVLRSAGVSRPRGAPSRVSRDDVLRLHAQGLSPREIAPQVGASAVRVAQLVAEAGLKPNTAPLAPTARDIEAARRRQQVLVLHRRGLPAGEIAARMGVTPVTVYRILGEEGLRPNVTPEAERARERREEAITLHQQGLSGSEIAQRLEISEPAVVAILREFRPAPPPGRAREFEDRAYGLLPYVESLRWDASQENLRLTELMLQNQASEAGAHVVRLPEFPRREMEEEGWRVAFVRQQLRQALKEMETFRICQAQMGEAQKTALPKLKEQAQRCIDQALQLLRECCPPLPRPSPFRVPRQCKSFPAPRGERRELLCRWRKRGYTPRTPRLAVANMAIARQEMSTFSK